jgi:DNA-binding NarL/FixJ family response regulator
MNTQKNYSQRILIASGHPLFGKGLVSLLKERWGESITIVGLVANIEDLTTALTNLKPDLLVVDYDDHRFKRNKLLQQFIKSSGELRIVLLSLEDGKEGAEAIVYDRRTMQASRIEDWLEIKHQVNQTNRGESQ